MLGIVAFRSPSLWHVLFLVLPVGKERWGFWGLAEALSSRLRRVG